MPSDARLIESGAPPPRALTVTTGLLAAVPVMVALVQVVADRWTAISDDGLIATRAYDVLSRNSPLLGPWSSGYSDITGHPTFHPGPLLFWLLAVPAHLPWPELMVITVAVVNVAAVLGVVALAGRRGGVVFMFATAVAVLLMLSSLPADAYADIWNPSAPILPFTLLIFLAWSLAVGEHRLLPLAVLVASFVAQCHLSYLLPAILCMAVGIAGLAWARRRAPRTESMRPWVIAAVVVALVCWSFPLVDQLTNRPGNMVLIVRASTADSHKLGLHDGWHALAHGVGIVPWWLRAPQGGLERPIDIGRGTTLVQNGSTVLVLAALVALGLLGWRRGRRDVVAATVLALATSAAIALVTASTPANSIGTLSYSLRWAQPAGMFAWLALGWSALSLVRLPSLAPSPAIAAPALAALLVVAIVVAASGELRGEPYRPMRTIADHLDAVPSTRPVRVINSVAPDPPGGGFVALGIDSGVVYELRRAGRAIDAPLLSDYLGPAYGGHGADEQTLRLDVGTRPPADARVLTRVRLTQYPDPTGGLQEAHPTSWPSTVSLVP
jgi:hypothetical protein